MTSTNLDINKDINPFIAVRPSDAYSKQVHRNIKLLSFYPNGLADVFGSYAYRIQRYPGDIDLIEEYDHTSTLESAVTSFEKRLKTVVKEILQLKQHYFSEFKAGLDNRYDINIGTLEDGLYTFPATLIGDIEDLHERSLLTINEYNTLKAMLVPFFDHKATADVYDQVYSIFRNRMILRWTADEVLEGSCVREREEFLLKDALAQKTHIKIDVLLLENDRFIEMTNFVGLAYTDDTGYHPINVDLREKDLVQKQLPIEIEKLYYSNFYYNPFKCVKRMWSLARSTHNHIILGKLQDIISSTVSEAYQIKSDLDVLARVLEKTKTSPMSTILTELDRMKNRMANVLQLDGEDLTMLFDGIDAMSSGRMSKRKLTESIEQLRDDILDPIVAHLTISYLISVGLNPPPKEMLPKKHKYTTQLVRGA